MVRSPNKDSFPFAKITPHITKEVNTMGIILFILAIVFIGSLAVAFVYTLPKLLIIAMVSMVIYYIIDSIRYGRFD